MDWISLADWRDCHWTRRCTVKKKCTETALQCGMIVTGLEGGQSREMDRINFAEWRVYYWVSRWTAERRWTGSAWQSGVIVFKVDNQEKMYKFSPAEWRDCYLVTRWTAKRKWTGLALQNDMVSRWTAKRNWTGSAFQSDVIVTGFQGGQRRENGQDRPCRMTRLLLGFKVNSKEKMDRIGLAEWRHCYWTSRWTVKRKWTGSAWQSDLTFTGLQGEQRRENGQGQVAMCLGCLCYSSHMTDVY